MEDADQVKAAQLIGSLVRGLVEVAQEARLPMVEYLLGSVLVETDRIGGKKGGVPN